MPGRKFSSEQYRYGYQGSERDPEMSGGAGYTTYFRALDSRIGRWLTPDPKVFPWQSPYVSMDGNPVALVDVWGASTDGGGTETLNNADGSVDEYAKNGLTGEYEWHQIVPPMAVANTPANRPFVPVSTMVFNDFELQQEVMEYNPLPERQLLEKSGAVKGQLISSKGIEKNLSTDKLELILQSHVWIGGSVPGVGGSLGGMEVSFDITSVTGVWEFRATTGEGGGLNGAFGADFEGPSVLESVSSICFYETIEGNTLADIMNQTNSVTSRVGGVIVAAGKAEGHMLNDDYTERKVWDTGIMLGGGIIIGYSGGRSKPSWINVPLSKNDSIIRSLNDPTLIGGDELLLNTFGGSNRDSIGQNTWYLFK